MSIPTELLDRFPQQVSAVRTDKVEVHGERATLVQAYLFDGRVVEGTFTNESKPGFGGVDFQSKKDVVGLMTAKINSVLRGTSEN